MWIKAIRFLLMAESVGDGAGETVSTGATETPATATTETSAATPTEATTETTATAETGETPIAYTDFTVPEGVALDSGLLDEFKGLAAGMKLDQAQAQALTDMGVKITQNVLNVQAQALETQKAAWLAEVKADKEIGGDKLDENMTIAARAIKEFVPDDVKALFDKTGVGNHPGLVKAFVKIGALLKEDGVVTGGMKPGGDSSAKSMYPNSPGLV